MNRAVVLAACLPLFFLSSFAQGQTPRVGQDLMPQDAQGRIYLFGRLSGGMTLDRYLTLLRAEFTRHDADGNGTLDEVDADTHVNIAQAAMRMSFVMQVFQADLDGDGAVTETELRQKLTYDRRRNGSQQRVAGADEQFEREVAKLIEADADKDGRITFKEALDRGKAQAATVIQSRQGMGAPARQMLSVSPEGKTSLAAGDLETVARTFFASVDKDGNGTISLDEIDAQRDRIQRDRTEMQNEREAHRAVSLCNAPKASANAKVILLGGYKAQSLSTVALGSQEIVTGVGNIVVEPGTEPLYLLISSHQPTIWRFYGAVERVERVVITAGHGAQPKILGGALRNLAGATGLPAGRLTFPDETGCLRYFSDASSSDAARMSAVAKAVTGKDPHTTAARYEMIAFNVPSGKIESIGGDRPGLMIVQDGVTYMLKDGKMTTIKPNQSLASELDRFTPGGVVTVDAKTVVAPMPVEPYDVLPQEAGLMQLIESGALTRNGSDYMINRKIRMPAGLYGAHSVKFLLRRSVPEPDGDPGHSKIISEETGKPLPRQKG